MTLSFYHTASNLGGPIVMTRLSEGVGGVFANVNIDQATAGQTDYACVVIRNEGGSTIANAGVYFASKAANAKFYIALGLTGKNSYTEQVLPTATTTPVGNLIFQNPTFDYAPLVIGALNYLDIYHLWIKRVVAVNAPGEAAPYLILTGTES
jgi:hypothetical protein